MEGENLVPGYSEAILPRYRCHKVVGALKIMGLEPHDAEKTYLVPALENYPTFTVSNEWVKKHNPQSGGYFVVYEDGYSSYSPAEAFESGYSLIGEEVPGDNDDLSGLLDNFIGLKAEALRHEMVCKVLDESNFSSAEDAINHADTLVDYVLNGKKGVDESETNYLRLSSGECNLGTNRT